MVIVRNAAGVVTCAAKDGDVLGFERHGCLAIEGERIVAVGQEAEVCALASDTVASVVDARGGVVMPGFVDCHTHAVFGGHRRAEYLARAAGQDVQRLASTGVAVGILGTVAQTRGLEAEELADAARPRLRQMLAAGTTTVESKSGYGLDLQTELTLLQTNRVLNASQPIDIVSTFMGAHAFPAGGSRQRYVDSICEEMLPRVAEERLAEFCDVYCDEGYFSVRETERILSSGREHGLVPKIHLDCYSYTGAATLAAALRCASVDHLNFTPTADLEILAGAGVSAVALPLLDFATKHPRPLDPARMAASGVTLALATDLCPACHATSMQTVIARVCRGSGLPVAQAVAAATYGAATAIRRDHLIGSLVPGKLADLVILDTDDVGDLAYHLDGNLVRTVIKRGTVVMERSSA